MGCVASKEDGERASSASEQPAPVAKDGTAAGAPLACSSSSCQQAQPLVEASQCSDSSEPAPVVERSSSSSSLRQQQAPISWPQQAGQIKRVLQDLMSIPADVLDACKQVATVLQGHLTGIDSVILLASCQQPGKSVVMGAHGPGGAELLQHMLVLPHERCCVRLLGGSGNGNGSAPPIVVQRSVGCPADAEALPEDWALLHQHGGMRSFAAAPVMGQRLLGVLVLAGQDPAAFSEPWWEPVLSIIITGLVPLLQHPMTRGLCELTETLTAATSFASFAAQLLQGATAVFRNSTHMQVGLRLGVLSRDAQRVVVLSSRSAGGSRDGGGSSSNPVERRLLSGQGSASSPPSLGQLASAEAAAADLHMAAMAARNTLLLDATRRRNVRVVRNTASYLEAHVEPSHDVFVDEVDVVASIVVAPLLVGPGCEPYGALYVTHHLPIASSLDSLKGKVALMRLAALVQLLLATRSREAAWAELARLKAQRAIGRVDGPVTPPGSAGDMGASSPAGAALASAGSAAAVAVLGPAAASDAVLVEQQQQQATAGSQAGSPAAAAGVEPPSPSGGSGSSSSSSSRQKKGRSSSSKKGREARSTSSIMQTLQAQVQRSSDRHRDMAYVEELQLTRMIGRGGFGMVYEGTWKGSPAAIKVMYVQQHERQVMKNAMEMVVLTTIKHPAIVQVYACLTDMVEVAASGPGGAGSSSGAHAVRFVAATPGLDGSTAVMCNIVVMEHCDLGSLRISMRQGLLHKRTTNKGLMVDMRLLVSVLLEVARSLQYLHGLGIIHCDVKADNVLLKSSAASPTGFVAKLGDFGGVKLLLGKHYLTNRSGSGTVTHLAPELFEAGSKVTPAVDAFAFGIMMYELYSCQRPYAGLKPELIATRVFRQQQRPVFPPGTPSAFRALAEACWCHELAQRPAFDAIVWRLEGLLQAAGGAFTSEDRLQRVPKPLPR